ncbi:DUF3304 domain-containing protein [Bordetella sp. LUAb4]|uniref:DUF3304 domain-containing protein n=1 Tax=Bordetella sp. LUAb4 TaxID=2843195 RepID=UPI001E3C4C71|nr:DUF3304 domain-containing protein [Bordetella sp. LUAb4]
MNIFLLRRFAVLFLTGLVLPLAGCSDPNQSNPSELAGYNYTDSYIAIFSVSNEGQRLEAGGSNIYPKKPGEQRSESGGACCIGVPVHWRPDMRLVVRWRRDTKPYDDDRSGDQWLVAITKVPPYGTHTYGFWVHFLPDDRIRVQIQDDPAMPVKPADDDPYIVQGVVEQKVNPK